VGEFERPIRLPGDPVKLLGPIDAGASIAILPNGVFSTSYSTRSFVVTMSYEDYLASCDEDPFLEPLVTSLVRERGLEWLSLIGIGKRHELRVAKLVLSEWGKATDLGHEEFEIPMAFFRAYVGGDPEQPMRTLREKFAKKGLLKFEQWRTDGGAVLRILNVDVAKVKQSLGGTGYRRREDVVRANEPPGANE
jgi:hypothetical protein